MKSQPSPVLFESNIKLCRLRRRGAGEIASRPDPAEPVTAWVDLPSPRVDLAPRRPRPRRSPAPQLRRPPLPRVGRSSCAPPVCRPSARPSRSRRPPPTLLSNPLLPFPSPPRTLACHSPYVITRRGGVGGGGGLADGSRLRTARPACSRLPPSTPRPPPGPPPAPAPPLIPRPRSLPSLLSLANPPANGEAGLSGPCNGPAPHLGPSSALGRRASIRGASGLGRARSNPRSVADPPPSPPEALTFARRASRVRAGPERREAQRGQGVAPAEAAGAAEPRLSHTPDSISRTTGETGGPITDHRARPPPPPARSSRRRGPMWPVLNSRY